ncbi:trypsin-like peptidase domain-containing protein [Methylomonas sp. HYX-M1]|uniref:trypsin-like peptidase domain-containing protein n=1 Tax=Methylomonas sp. HYX-M1 TaxID=3139307 RepID=UPI00345BBA6A
MTADDPELAIVSIYRDANSADGFIGSGFFISRQLILTARHNLLQQGENYYVLYIGMVKGEDKRIPLQPIVDENLFLFGDLDVAAICLNSPKPLQAYCRMDFGRDHYKNGLEVKYCGVDKDDKTVFKLTGNIKNSSTLDEKYDAYLIAHLAKPGSSGGAATTVKNGKEVAIGVVIDSDQQMNESRFIPLFYCFDWLRAINETLKDRELENQLSGLTQRQTSFNNPSLDDIFSQIQKLADYIERPAAAYTHLLSVFIKQKLAVKACICRYSDASDNPSKFCEVLAIRLAANAERLDCLKKINEAELFDVNCLEIDFWQARNKQEFFQLYVEEVYRLMKKDYDANKNFDRLCEEIFTPGKLNHTVLYHLISIPSVQNNKWFLINKNQKKEKQLKTRTAWINEFSDKLAAAAKTAGSKREFDGVLAIIFFIKAENNESILVEDGVCFNLDKISADLYNNWFGMAHNLLVDYFDSRCSKQILVAGINRFNTCFGQKFMPNGLYLQSFNSFLGHAEDIVTNNLPNNQNK